jgi:hypothetical protein
MLPCLAPVLFTFKIQGVLEFLKGGRAESVKHDLLNRLRSILAVNVLRIKGL